MELFKHGFRTHRFSEGGGQTLNNSERVDLLVNHALLWQGSQHLKLQTIFEAPAPASREREREG